MTTFTEIATPAVTAQFLAHAKRAGLRGGAVERFIRREVLRLYARTRTAESRWRHLQQTQAPLELACCGRFHALTSLPFTTPCCGRVYALAPLAPPAPHVTLRCVCGAAVVTCACDQPHAERPPVLACGL